MPSKGRQPQPTVSGVSGIDIETCLSETSRIPHVTHADCVLQANHLGGLLIVARAFWLKDGEELCTETVEYWAKSNTPLIAFIFRAVYTNYNEVEKAINAAYPQESPKVAELPPLP